MRGAILVTGGAGFIGSHLADALLSDGRRVVVLDNFDTFYDPAIKRGNLANCLGNDAFRLVEGDIRDSATLDELFAAESIEAVVHLAARAGVRPSIEDPTLYTSVNLDGTTRLLEACRRAGVRTFVFGSSSSVYGNNETVPFSESDPVEFPISPYAATKRAGELLCYAHHHLFDMRIACLRFFTVYGPRQRPEMAIHKFARRIAEGRSVAMFGDGGTARDYTFVSDIVRGVRVALERCDGFHIWNLGGSATTRLADLIAKIGAALGRNPEIEQFPSQPGDVERTWANIDKARKELDWAPSTGIDEGIERFIGWFREQQLPGRES